jgi:hypothetical protein
MGSQLRDRFGRWAETMGISRLAPGASALEAGSHDAPDSCRPGVSPPEIDAWERRHGFALPEGLRVWLKLSNGLYLQGGPLIHPLSAIGPMVPFARVPGLVIQPESWFELGNPNVETVCIDLGYRWPSGGPPIFTSGDDQSQSPPRVIARSFDEWFLELLGRGGREYWFDPDFQPLGHPWQAHREHAPAPPLPARLRPLAKRALPLMRSGVDERHVASALAITLGDVETLFRHLQHAPNGVKSS